MQKKTSPGSRTRAKSFRLFMPTWTTFRSTPVGSARKLSASSGRRSCYSAGSTGAWGRAARRGLRDGDAVAELSPRASPIKFVCY